MSGKGKVSDLLLSFVRPGESGQCGKECGSGNCCFSVVRGRCPGIIREPWDNKRALNDGGDLLRIQCDSGRISDRQEARDKLTSFVRVSSERGDVTA